MDLRMPGTDGVAATRQLKESDPDVKVVVLTTFATMSHRRRLLAGPLAIQPRTPATVRSSWPAVSRPRPDVLDPGSHSAPAPRHCSGRG